MSSEIGVCAVCAWRAACRKKFSVSGRDFKCPDFSRDITIKEKPEKDEEKEEEGK